MKSVQSFILLLFVTMLCSSCFQIIEEVTLKNNGSGEMRITLNMSQSKSKIASLLLLDSVNGHKIPSEADMRKYMDETVDFLKKAKGISNIRQSLDLKNYIAQVNFSFTDLSYVNGLTEKLFNDQKMKMPSLQYFYDKTAGIVKKQYRHSPELTKEYNKLKPKDKDIFKNAGFTSIFRFESAVAGNPNKQAIVSPSGKAVMLKDGPLEINGGTAKYSHTV